MHEFLFFKKRENVSQLSLCYTEICTTHLQQCKNETRIKKNENTLKKITCNVYLIKST